MKRLATVYKNQQKYNILNIDGTVYKRDLFLKELKEISGSLPKTNNENYLGKSKQSQSALKRNNSLHLYGMYIDLI